MLRHKTDAANEGPPRSFGGSLGKVGRDAFCGEWNVPEGTQNDSKPLNQLGNLEVVTQTDPLVLICELDGTEKSLKELDYLQIACSHCL